MFNLALSYSKTNMCCTYQPTLGAWHYKCWAKYAFSMFFVQKAEKGRKSKKIAASFSQKKFLFVPEHWPSVLFPEKRHS